ncbi:MAG: hypothetical protein JOS17DRAFT_543867 [Linnemannia elongata]|nr:MAG: hypothetical protein JOS17DRAFT_543867 [Linnemannia elongata]
MSWFFLLLWLFWRFSGTLSPFFFVRCLHLSYASVLTEPSSYSRVGECNRRWQWNFFRLENEHLNNCGQFRAIKDIPLPFHIRVQGESDDEDDEDDNSDNNRSSNQQYPHEDPDFVVHQEGVFHLHDGDQELEDRDQHGHFVDRDSIFPQMSLASSSPRRSGFGVGGGGGGLVRSSSSQSSFFGAFSNGSHAHGLSNLGSSIGGGVGTGDADGGGAGDVEVAGQNREASKSRTSLHSATSLSQPRRPYGGVTQRSFSHSSTTQGTAGGGGGEMASLRTKQSMASLKTKRSRASLHDSVTAGAAVSNTSLHQPFSTSRSNSFVDNAVAEAGFTGSQREILEAETASSKKFYDRRDFDSKIIEVESNSDLWRRQPRAPKERAMTGGATSLHGLQALSADGVLGGGGGGLDERILDSERRARSQVVVPRRKMSMGTRMRNSIFGRGRGQSSDSEDDEEADTE